MEDKSSRIRWNDDELGRLANAMAPLLLADPRLHPLEAVRAAQECLAPDRRRERKAWSLVAGRLQPRLGEALARRRAASPQTAGGDSRPQDDSPAAMAPTPVDAADAPPPGVTSSQPADTADE